MKKWERRDMKIEKRRKIKRSNIVHSREGGVTVRRQEFREQR